MGVAVCMDGALSLHASPDLRFVPLVPERTTRSVLVWKKNQVFNTATSLFIRVCRCCGGRRPGGSLRSGRNLKANTIIHVQAPG